MGSWACATQLDLPVGALLVQAGEVFQLYEAVDGHLSRLVNRFRVCEVLQRITPASAVSCTAVSSHSGSSVQLTNDERLAAHLVCAEFALDVPNDASALDAGELRGGLEHVSVQPGHIHRLCCHGIAASQNLWIKFLWS